MATVDDLSVRIAADTADFQAGAESVENDLDSLTSGAFGTAAAMQALEEAVEGIAPNLLASGKAAERAGRGFRGAALDALAYRRALGELSGATERAVLDFIALSDRVDAVGDEAVEASVELNVLSNRADEAGEQVGQAGTRASVAAGQFSMLSSSTSAANASFMGISATTWGSLIPAVVALGAALAPVIGALGGFVAVAGSIAAVGLLPTIGAIATETEVLREQFNAVVSTIKDAFAPVFYEAANVLVILMMELRTVIDEMVPAQDVIQNIAGNFAQLGVELINALPAFVDLAVVLTQEFLPPFVTWMQGFLADAPDMIMGLVSVLDRMLPRFMEAGFLLMRLLPPFTEFGFTVLNVLGPALADMARIGTDVLSFFNTLDSRIQNAGASLALLLPVITTMASLLGGPVTLAFAGVVGAIAAFGKAWQSNFAGVRTFLANLHDDVQRILPSIRGAFDAFVSGFDISAVQNAIDGLEESMGDQLKQTLESLQPVFQDIITFFNENQQELRTLGETASWITVQLINFASAVVNILVPAIRTFMIPALRTMVDVMDWLLEATTTWIEAMQAIRSGDLAAAGNAFLESDAPGELGEIVMPNQGGQRQSFNEMIEVVVENRIEGELPEESIRDVSTSVVDGERRATRRTQGRDPTPR